MASDARTVADLERKYNFAEMLGMTKNVKMNEKSITKVENELLSFVITTTENIESLQEQIDGQIMTWFYTGAPTLSNVPANEWTTNVEKDRHLGDLYYDNATGYAYRFAKQVNTYLWIKIVDTDVTEALSRAQAAQDTADGKRRVFTTTPTPPYDVGDLWSKTGELKVCKTTRQSGSYLSSDWEIASTDDSSLNTFVTVTYASDKASLINQIDGKVETWYYSGIPTLSNSPASQWTTDADKQKHIGDMYYDKSTGYSYIFEYDTVYKWNQIQDSDISTTLALANAAQDTADNKRRVFLSQPTPPYDNGDLWVGGSGGDIKACQISKTSEQAFDFNDWILASKYTDDTKATAIVNELGGTTTTVLSGQVVTYMKNYAKFTDLATGGSTIINGANISTGTINTDNVRIGNDNVLIDEDGIKLKNGAKVVGENGLMNTYIYTSGNFDMCGYSMIDPTGWDPTQGINKKGVKIDINIPDGLNITSAKLDIFHAPTYWSQTDMYGNDHYYWGYARGIRAYKATNIYSRKFEAQMGSEYVEINDTTYQEIAGAFGTNGWTPTAPSQASHNTERKTSIDIKSSLSSGLNEILIQPGDNPETSWSAQEVCERTAFVYAMLKIDGYMSY